MVVVARLPGLGRHRAGLAACVMLSVLAVMAVLAPWIAPRDPLAQSRADRFLPPSLTYPFGSDEFGRDILSRVIHGARISLLTGAVAVLIGGTVGVPLGLLGGFAGGLADAAIMRVLDFLLAVPAILLAMVIIAILGPGSFNAMLAVGVVSVPSFARLTRASTLEVGRIAGLATERPAFTVDPAFYRSVGLEPRDAKIVVVKSPLQFRDGYGAIARAGWVVDTPGPSTARLERLDWRHRSRPLFPFDDEFEPEIRAVLGPGRGGGGDRR